MSDKYILKGHETIPEEDLIAWAKWFETADRHVGDDEIETPQGIVRVSTVFLGLDYQFHPEGPPLLFETLVFGGKHDNEMERYSTWDEAEEGHKRMVALVKSEK